MEFIFDLSEIYAHAVGHGACWKNHPQDVLVVHESSHKPCSFSDQKRGDCGYPDKLFCRNPSHKKNATHGIL